MKNVKDFDNFLNEATESVAGGPSPLSILSVPFDKLGFGVDSAKPELIYLKDQQGQKLTYEMLIDYGIFSLDLEARNIKRESDGGLSGEAKATGFSGKAAMALIPSSYKTSDGYLKFKIPAAKLKQAIEALKKNAGKSAKVAAEGKPGDPATAVTITLTRV